MLKEGGRGSPRVAAIIQSLEDALDEYERKKPPWFIETGERPALRISSSAMPRKRAGRWVQATASCGTAARPAA
jgi:hypothetical protein